MIQTPGLLLTILAFALVIGPLVFIHEMGHYLAGRWFGVKVEAFSIGFGREIAGWTDKRGTRWKVAALPLGGYVKFAGDMTASGRSDPDWLLLPAEERAQTFHAKPVWQRAIIVAAGPVINFVLAILILAGFALAYGDAQTPAVVGEAMPGTAAAQAGLRAGDRIEALGGRHVDTFEDMVRFVKIRAGERVRIDYVRADQPTSVETVIGTLEQRDRFGNEYKVGLLGIAPTSPVVRPVGLFEAPVVAVRRTGDILQMMVETVGQIVSGRRSVKELGGPLAIAKVSGEQITLGWDAFVFLLALVSINLGFINLLPVPMLDGGHLLFYLIEAIRRKPVGPEAQEWAYRGGLAAVLALMMLVTFNDLGNFGLWRHLAGLIG
ncbi:RIP metalloprotease RseP [Sphingomonas sp. RHCKR47]|uniref:RIP metalloprotease RseP n=1 Tax=Sphingomonas citricola TaxID=2862498 RepID=UPI001CA4C11C|nr:RIP metalloprotease RseP [Sphingomonas citricola]MBW6523610.1 RIP metalloprotease RseP [Sphingomonas citricola]